MEVFLCQHFIRLVSLQKSLGLSITTLRRWDKEGKLKPAKVTDGGTRLYSEEQLINYSRSNTNKERVIIAYSINNMQLLEQYLVSRGYRYKVVSNVIDMINLVEANDVERIVFYCRDDVTIDGIDSVTSSSYRLFKEICKLHGVVIEFVKEVI